MSRSLLFPIVAVLAIAGIGEAADRESISVVPLVSLSGPQHADRMASVAFSPDGSLLAAGSGRAASSGSHGEVTLWQWRSKSVLATLEGHGGLVASVAFSADGQWLVGGGYRLTIWDVEHTKLLHRWRADGLVHALVVMPDKSTLVTAARGKPYATVWNVSSERRERKLFANQSRNPSLVDTDMTVVSLDLSLDGKTLAMGGYEQSASFWNTADWTLRSELTEPNPKGSRFIRIMPNGLIAFCEGDGSHSGRLINIETRQAVCVLEEHDHLVGATAVSSDGRLVATAGMEDVCIWSSKSGKLVWSQRGEFWSVAFSPDSRLLAVGSGSGSVTVYKIWR